MLVRKKQQPATLIIPMELYCSQQTVKQNFYIDLCIAMEVQQSVWHAVSSHAVKSNAEVGSCFT